MAAENGSRVHACVRGEALRKRRNAAIRCVKLHSFDAMHGKKDYSERGRIARFDHRDQIFERAQFDAGEAEPLRSQRKNQAPELLSRISQGQKHQGAGLKRISGRKDRGIV